MILTKEQVDHLKTQIQNNNTTARTGIAPFAKFWPNRTVFFTINAGLSDQARITNAIAHWQSQTNITFVQRTNQANYVEFVTGSGCSSYIGMVGGRQEVTLAPECSTGNAIHEIGHAIGFFHEQSRADRGNFIIINTNNIIQGRENNFETYTARGEQGFEIGTFDFGSIMLYDSYAFSKNGLPTITRLNGSTFTSQRNGLSAGDIETYNYMYNRPFFTLDVENYRYESGSNWYRHTQDVILRAYTDASMTTPLNATVPWRVSLKKTTSGTNYPIPLVEYHIAILQAGTNSLKIGEEFHEEEYIGGTENFVTDESWTLGNYIVSRP